MQDPSLDLSPRTSTVVLHGFSPQYPNPPASPPPGAAVVLVGEARVIGPHWAHAPILGSVFFGTQVIWSTEMAYGMSHTLQISVVSLNSNSEASSYLHSLGLSKAAACLVLLAGPLSGLVVQPLAGAFADRTTSRYGRRKPFMLIGSLACAISMLVLSWAQELSSALNGVSPDVSPYFLVVTLFYRAKEEQYLLLPYHSILLISP